MDANFQGLSLRHLPFPLVACLAALLAPPARAMDAAPLEVRALWVETGLVPPALRVAMIHAAASILSPARVVVRWRVGKADTVSGPEELRVVAIEQRGRGAGAGRILGATSNGPGSRTIWVNYPNVAWAAGTTVDALSSAGFHERRRAAIALGRVVAHEIVHALVPDLPHADVGVMSERLKDSLDRPLGLDPLTTEALLAANRRAREAGSIQAALALLPPAADPPPLVADSEPPSEGLP